MVIEFVLAATLCIGAAGHAQGPDTAERDKALQEFLTAFKHDYVFPEVAEKAAVMLDGHIKARDYDSIADNTVFVHTVTDQLREICKDAHLHMGFSAKVQPERKTEDQPSAGEVQQQKEFDRFTNGGYEQVQRLAGNVGYLEVRAFEDAADAKDAAEGAMQFLSKTDALILDLRRNGGGDPRAVQLLCSYFFDRKPVHLNDLVARDGKVLFSSWTLANIPGKRYMNKPVFVLTSKRTGSGAEECAYDLQTTKRATIVGESTWGGANPGEQYRLTDHFSAFIPHARARNPYTNMNWEGTGVIPDTAVPADKALETAQVLALKELIAHANSQDQRERYQQALTDLQPKTQPE